jgi:hypothetical protein
MNEQSKSVKNEGIIIKIYERNVKDQMTDKMVFVSFLGKTIKLRLRKGSKGETILLFFFYFAFLKLGYEFVR